MKAKIKQLMVAIFTWLGTKLGINVIIPIIGKLLGDKMLIPAFETLLGKEKLKAYVFDEYYKYAQKDLIVKTEIITVKNRKARYEVMFIATSKGKIRINFGRYKNAVYDEMECVMPEKISPLRTAKNAKQARAKLQIEPIVI